LIFSIIMIFSQNIEKFKTMFRVAGLLIPGTDMERRRFIARNLIFHLRPAAVVENTLRFTLSWGLGGMALVLVLVQLVTGILLKFAYDPTPASAYASIQLMIAYAPFGRLIHNIHYWSANLLVLVVFLHMLRVFFTGAFHPPRQFNWIIGLFQFGLILGANFTGYLLPFDQLAYWAVTVSAGMLEYIPWAGSGLKKLILSGPQIGPQTIRLFYAFHTAVIPIFIVIFMAFHFWRVRKAGGLVVPGSPRTLPPNEDFRVSSIPHLFVREAVTALVLLAVVVMAAIFFDAPLGEPANPGLSPNPTKAPWYFAGFQETLLHIHPVFAVFAIPFSLSVFFMAIPYLKYDAHFSGIWFVSTKGKRLAVMAGSAALIVAPGLIMLSEWIVQPGVGVLGPPSVIRDGLIPFIGIFFVFMGFYLLIRKRFAGSKSESVQALFLFAVVIFVVLTTIGACLRGPSMTLGFFR
jgi:quinol-cytochrome oxidoreductase complex cytochrome b subunit